MADTTTDRCRRHQMEPVEAECASCDAAYCAQCLVYVRGPAKPPLCVECALARSGVRSGARVPKLGWRERRRQEKFRKRAEAVIRATQTRRATDPVIDEAPYGEAQRTWHPDEVRTSGGWTPFDEPGWIAERGTGPG